MRMMANSADSSISHSTGSSSLVTAASLAAANSKGKTRQSPLGSLSTGWWIDAKGEVTALGSLAALSASASKGQQSSDAGQCQHAAGLWHCRHYRPLSLDHPRDIQSKPEEVLIVIHIHSKDDVELASARVKRRGEGIGHCPYLILFGLLLPAVQAARSGPADELQQQYEATWLGRAQLSIRFQAASSTGLWLRLGRCDDWVDSQLFIRRVVTAQSQPVELEYLRRDDAVL